MSARACILGCSGLALTLEEGAFFREVRPWGFILFARNIDNADQVRRLVDELRASVDRPEAPTLGLSMAKSARDAVKATTAPTA